MEVGNLWVKLGIDRSDFKAALNEVKGETKTLGDFFRGAFQFTVGQGMFDLIKNGIQETIGLGFQFNSTMEQNLAAFKVMLGGSEQEAQKLVGTLQQMASRTPFETTDLTNAAQTMMQFGISSKEVEKNLQMLGDASMGNSEKMKSLTLAFSQVQATGKLTGQDLLQMINAGFNPLQEISEKTGMSMKSLKDAMEKGAISSEMVSKAFESATSKGGRFYKSMDEQSKTFSGQMSTLKDNLATVFGEITKGVFDKLSKEILPGLIDKFSKFAEALKNGGIKEALKTMIPAEVIDALFSIQSVFAWIVSHWELVKVGIIGIGTAFATFQIITSVQKWLGGLTLGMKLYTVAQGIATGVAGAFGSVMAFITSPIGIAIAIITAIAGVVYLLIRNWETAGPFFKSLWEMIKSAFEFGKASIWVALTAIGAALANWYNLTLGNVVRFVSSILGIFSKIPGVGDAFKGLQGITDKVANAMQGVANAANKSFDAAKRSAGKAIDDMGKNFKTLGNTGKTMAKDIGADISGLFKGAKDKVSGMLTGMKVDSKDTSKQVKVDWSSAAGDIKSAMNGASNSAKENKKAVDSASESIKENKNIATMAAEAIKDKYQTAVLNLKEAVKRLVIDNKDNYMQDIINTREAVTKQEELIDTLKKKYEELRATKGMGEDATATQQAKAKMEEEITNLEKLNDRLTDLTQKREEKITKIVEDARSKAVTKINNLNDLIIKALQKRYEQEKKDEEKKIKDSLKNYEDYVKKQRKIIESKYDLVNDNLDETTNTEVKKIQGQIDSIDKQEEEQERALKNVEEIQRIAALKAKLKAADDAEEKQKIQEDLDNAIMDQARRLEKQKNDDLKEALRTRIDELKDGAEQIKKQTEKDRQKELDALQKDLEKKQEEYQKDIEKLNEHYDKRSTAISLKMDAEKLLIGGKQDDIIKLLGEYGDKYETSGTTIGQKLIDGIKKGWDKLASDNIKDMMNQLSSLDALKSNLGVPVPNLNPAKDIPAISKDTKSKLPANTSLSGDTKNIDSVASKIGSAIVSAMQFTQPKQTGKNADVVLQVDSTQLARVMMPAIAKEQTRVGSAIIQGA